MHAVQERKDIPLFSRLVDIEEVRGNDHNLNIIRYVQTTPPPPKVNIENVLQSINLEKEQLNQDYEDLHALLKGFNL